MSDAGDFDQITRRITNEAIARVDAAADEAWKRAALEAVHRVATENQFFTPDEIWKYVEKPREPRALGPVMLRAARWGWCAKTGRVAHSVSVTQHRNHLNVWRSYICTETSAEVPEELEVDNMSREERAYLRGWLEGVKHATEGTS